MKQTIAILIFFVSTSIFSATDFYRPSQHFPLEFIYLSNSLQSKKKSDKEYAIFLKYLKVFDRIAQNMTKEKTHLYVKSEIYKVIFKERPKAKLDINYFKKEIIEKVENKLKNGGKEKLTPFTYWFIEASVIDLRNLFESKTFEQLKKIIFKKEKYKNDKEKNLKKKLDIVISWTSLFLSVSLDEFEDRFTDVMKKINIRLNQYSTIYLTILKLKNDSKKLVHFNISEKSPDKKGIAYINYLLDLENMGIEKDRIIGPKLDWLPKDAPDKIRIPSKQKKSLISKGKANSSKPIPINDWQIDID